MPPSPQPSLKIRSIVYHGEKIPEDQKFIHKNVHEEVRSSRRRQRKIRNQSRGISRSFPVNSRKKIRRSRRIEFKKVSKKHLGKDRKKGGKVRTSRILGVKRKVTAIYDAFGDKSYVRG